MASTTVESSTTAGVTTASVTTASVLTTTSGNATATDNVSTEQWCRCMVLYCKFRIYPINSKIYNMTIVYEKASELRISVLE